MSSVGKRQPPGKQLWRSLDEVADTPEFREFMHREFPAGASEMLDGADRRHFLKIMGASMALAGMGLTGCRRWPEEQIAPFAHRPAGRTPGMPRQFATALEMGGVTQGLLVTSYDGRPIKVEGNPEHPINRGATDHFAQAAILDLYDPDRSQTVLHDDLTSWTAGIAAYGVKRAVERGLAGHGQLASADENCLGPRFGRGGGRGRCRL